MKERMAFCKDNYTNCTKTGLDFNPSTLTLNCGSVAFWHHAIRTLILIWEFRFGEITPKKITSKGEKVLFLKVSSIIVVFKIEKSWNSIQSLSNPLYMSPLPTGTGPSLLSPNCSGHPHSPSPEWTGAPDSNPLESAPLIKTYL